MNKLFTIFFVLYSVVVLGQENTVIFDSKIKSLQVTPVDKPLENAVIKLLGGDKLHIRFDYLLADVVDFRYEVHLCNQDWSASELHESESLDKIGEFYFEDVQNSVNTNVQYVHYSTTLPHEYLKFKLAGNYILKVYNDFTEQLAFQVRFRVIEQLVRVDASIKQATRVQLMDTHHECDIEILPLGFPIANPAEEIYIEIIQNGREDNKIGGFKPSHINNTSFKYDYNKENTIKAGSEFYQFSFRNLRVADEEVKDVVFNKNIYEIRLKQDEIRAFRTYDSEMDLNGSFLPSFYDRPQNSDTDADYVMVFFDLKYPAPVEDTVEMYVVGKFNQWQLNQKNKMVYIPEQQAFRSYILLKQGYCDYGYAMITPNSKGLDMQSTMGSFYQTRNNYEIFVYYKDIETGYDRIIGYLPINN